MASTAERVSELKATALRAMAIEPVEEEPAPTWWLPTARQALAFGLVALLLGGALLAYLWWRPAPAPLYTPRAPAAQPAAPLEQTDTAPSRPGTARPPASPPPGATEPPRSAPAAGPPTGELVVHVAGAVRRPGLVRLPAGARVADALVAADQALPEADLDALNLARPLTDGEKVYVPLPGQAPPADAAPDAVPGGQPGPRATSGPAPLVDINTADATTLQNLPGIGPALAVRIVDFRAAHGPFASLDGLLDVPGIGPAKLAALAEVAYVP